MLFQIAIQYQGIFSINNLHYNTIQTNYKFKSIAHEYICVYIYI